jgi:hypothetical protein
VGPFQADNASEELLPIDFLEPIDREAGPVS